MFHFAKRSGGRQLVKPLTYIIQQDLGSPHPAPSPLVCWLLGPLWYSMILLAHGKLCPWISQINLGVLLLGGWGGDNGLVVIWIIIPSYLLPYNLSIHPCPLLHDLLGPTGCEKTWYRQMCFCNLTWPLTLLWCDKRKVKSRPLLSLQLGPQNKDPGPELNITRSLEPYPSWSSPTWISQTTANFQHYEHKNNRCYGKPLISWRCLFTQQKLTIAGHFGGPTNV